MGVRAKIGESARKVVFKGFNVYYQQYPQQPPYVSRVMAHVILVDFKPGDFKTKFKKGLHELVLRRIQLFNNLNAYLPNNLFLFLPN